MEYRDQLIAVVVTANIDVGTGGRNGEVAHFIPRDRGDSPDNVTRHYAFPLLGKLNKRPFLARSSYIRVVFGRFMQENQSSQILVPAGAESQRHRVEAVQDVHTSAKS